MALKSRTLYCQSALIIVLTLTTSSAFSQTPVDTTKLREPYPEPKSAFAEVMSVPVFILDIPFDILKGITKFVVSDLQIGPMASNVINSVNDIKNSTGFYPAFGTGGRSGVQFGVGFTSQPVWTEQERLKLKATYSTHDYQTHKALYRVPDFISSNFHMALRAQYTKKPWELFHGLGNESLESNKVNYNPERSNFQAVGTWEMAPRWEFEFSGGYNAYNIFDGEDPKLEGNVSDILSQFSFSPDVMRGTRFWTAGAALNHDWRNSKGRTTSGGQEIINIAYNMSTRDTDELEFWKVSVDLRQHLELFKQRTLAFRVLVQSVDVSDNSPILPFYLLTGLGGPDNLRGYRTDRFMDNDAVLASVEYRYPLLEVIDAFIFVDEGRVFSSISEDFKWHDWKYSYGGGLRIFNRDNLLARVFVAKGKEAARFNLEFGGSF